MRNLAYGLLFMLNSITISMFAQFNTERAFGGNDDDEIVFVSKDKNGGYLIAGETTSYTTSGSDAFFMRVDAGGTDLWQDYIANSDNSQTSPIAICNSNSSDPDEYIIVMCKNGGGPIQIAKYNQLTKQITLRNTYAVASLNNIKAHNFFPIESTNPSESGYLLGLYAEPNSGDAQVTYDCFIKFDNDLNYVNTIYNTQGWNQNFTDALIGADGNIYITGNIGSTEVFLVKTDKNLNVDAGFTKQYSVELQYTTARYSYVRFSQDANGNFVFVTSHIDGNTNANVSKTIIVTDSNGGNETVHEFGALGDADLFIRDVAVVDGGYVFIGYTGPDFTNHIDPDNTGATSEEIVLLWVESDFSKITSRVFGDVGDDRGVFVYPNDDNTVTIFANSESFGNGIESYVIKTDNQGNSLCNIESFLSSTPERVFNAPAATLAYTTTGVTLQAQSVEGYMISASDFTPNCTCNMTAEFATSAPACVGEPVMFTFPGSELSNIDSWSFGSGYSVDSINGNIIWVSYSTAGVKNVTLHLDGCVTVGSQDIIIFAAPVVEIGVNASTYCEGATFDFRNNGTTGDHLVYDWDFGEDANPAMSTAQNPNGIEFSGVGNKIVTLRIADQHCSNMDTVTFAISPSPKADFEAISPVCTGENVQFVNKTIGGTSYEWNFDLASAEGTALISDPTHIYAAPGDKVVELVATTGLCTDTVVRSVVIHETPGVSFTTSGAATNPFCTGSLVDFDATVSSTMGQQWEYEWNFGKGSADKFSTVQDPSGVEITQAGDIDITLTVKDKYCSATVTNTITITQTPTAGFSTNEPQCTGETVEFMNVGTTGISYNWDFGTGADVSILENPTFVYTNAEGAGEKLVQLVAINGACSDTAKYAITIHATPQISFLSDVATQNCAGDDIAFTSTVMPGTPGVDWTYAWDFGAGAKPSASTAENPVGISYVYGGSKEVSLLVQSDYCSNFVTEIIAVDELPAPDVIEDDTVCADRCLNIGGVGIAGATYNWYPSTTLNSSLFSNPLACPVAAYTTYTVKVTDANGCVGYDTVNITMLQAAEVNAGIDGEICRNESFQIGAAFVEGQTYSWSPATGLDNPASATPVATPDSTTTYTVSVQYKGCEIVSDDVVVLVHQLPLVRAYIEDHLDSLTIAKGESVQLFAIGATQYEWSPWEGLNNEGIFNPMASPETTTSYAVTGTDIYGCANADTVLLVVVEPSTWIPNAFSPNDDDLNDVFYVRAKEATKFEISIYSRTGQVVFHSGNIAVGWDGTNQTTGEEMPQGAYVYHMKGTLSDGETFNEKGIINLIR